MRNRNYQQQTFYLEPENRPALSDRNSSSLIERFLSSLDRKPKTKESYRKALKPFFMFLQDRNITQPDQEDILDYKRYLNGKEYTVATRSSYLTAVKSFFVYLEARKIYPNIAAGIEPLKKNKRQTGKQALTIGEAKAILQQIERSTLEGKRDFAFINLLLRTGLRTIEAERANVEDITVVSGQAVLFIQGKGRDSKDDYVVLTEETHGPIREYLAARKEEKPKSPLFCSLSDRNYGQRLTTRSMSRIVKNALKQAYLDRPTLTAHSLRHTAVTLSLIAGATIQEAQTFARHADINTTLAYAHNLDRIGKAPEYKIDALLASNI